MCNKSGSTVVFLLIAHCEDDSEFSVYGSEEDADRVMKDKKDWLRYVEGMSCAVSNLMEVWAKSNPIPQECYVFGVYSQAHTVDNNHPIVLQREKDRLQHLQMLEELTGLGRVRKELFSGRANYNLSDLWWEVIKVPFYPTK